MAAPASPLENKVKRDQCEFLSELIWDDKLLFFHLSARDYTLSQSSCKVLEIFIYVTIPNLGFKNKCVKVTPTMR